MATVKYKMGSVLVALSKLAQAKTMDEFKLEKREKGQSHCPPFFQTARFGWYRLTFSPKLGGIVIRILHHVDYVHDVCSFVPMRLFGEKAAWVYQAHDN